MNIYTQTQPSRLATCTKEQGTALGGGNGGGDDTSLSIVFNIVVTLENHVKVLYSKKKKATRIEKKLKWTTNRNK